MSTTRVVTKAGRSADRRTHLLSSLTTAYYAVYFSPMHLMLLSQRHIAPSQLSCRLCLPRVLQACACVPSMPAGSRW